MPINFIKGTDAGQLLLGAGGDDLIYGFDPDAAQANPSSITALRILTGLSTPLSVSAPPGDPNRIFVVEKTGFIRILDVSAADAGTYSLLPTPLLDVSAQISTIGERGLLGLTFDPDFVHNGYFYVNLINAAADTEIRRYQISANDPNRADVASAQLILTIPQAATSNHKAGWLGFGPDGYLYAALGDGGATPEAAQDINNLRGKILRLDVHNDGFPGDAGRNYAIPSDNPFVNAPGADEIYAMGLRNPWRDSFDRATGRFFIGDVGQLTWEEINLGTPGANYGWPAAEGPDGMTPAFTAPIHYYHAYGNGAAVIGGYVYRGDSDFLQGQYLYGDLIHGTIATLSDSSGTWTSTDRTAQVIETAGAITVPTSFGEDARGNIYLTDFDGELYRLTANGTSNDGNDIIMAGSGNDQVFAGAGDDQVFGNDNDDLLSGMSGNDALSGGAGADRVDGGAGNDTLDGDAGADWLYGGAGVDVARGGAGDDILYGGIGADQLIGGAGDDTSFGGTGDDWHLVDATGDRVIERAGEGTADRVFAATGYTLTPGAEIEIFSTDNHAGTGAIDLTGNDLANAIYGNAGANVVSGAGGNDSLFGRDGNDTLRGGAANDRLEGGNGSDVLFGDADDDQLYGDAGADQMTGGTGSDWFIVDDAGDTVIDGVGEGAADRVFTGVSYTLTANAEIEIFSTTFHAGSDALELTGNERGNLIYGNAGDNVIAGSAGNDTLYGFGGSNAFLFDSALDAANNVDRLADFNPANDVIRLDDAIFALPSGALAAQAFGLGSAPQDADDRILYDGASGRIYYDADGLAGGTIQFATVTAGLALTAADFIVV